MTTSSETRVRRREVDPAYETLRRQPSILRRHSQLVNEAIRTFPVFPALITIIETAVPSLAMPTSGHVTAEAEYCRRMGNNYPRMIIGQYISRFGESLTNSI